MLVRTFRERWLNLARENGLLRFAVGALCVTVALFSGAFAVGALSGQVLGGLLGGFLLSWLLERLKSGRGSAFLVHLAYWYGLSGARPESRKQRFFE